MWAVKNGDLDAVKSTVKVGSSICHQIVTYGYVSIIGGCSYKLLSSVPKEGAL